MPRPRYGGVGEARCETGKGGEALNHEQRAMSIYGEASDGLSDGLGVSGCLMCLHWSTAFRKLERALSQGGRGPKAEVKNPCKSCTDPVMAWYGGLPADHQQKAKIGGGYVLWQLACARLVKIFRGLWR